MIRHIRNIILTALFLGLITTNILTLFYQPFTTALSKITSKLFGIGTVTEILSTSLASKDKQLISQQRKISNLTQRQVRHKSAVKKFSNRFIKRMQKLAIISTSGSIAEMIPFIGIGAVVAGVGYEVYEYCQMTEDIQQLYLEAGLGEVEEYDIIKGICEQL